MATRDPFKAFTESFKRHRSVSEPIAADTWTFKDPRGRKRTARIEVGRPQQVPDDEHGDWFCPVYIAGWTKHVIPAMGVGPLDSLMNAIGLVRSFHEQIAWSQISHGTSKGTKRRN